MTRRLPRPGLRASVTAAFALGALLLSVALSVGTYVLARHLLLEQRERTALRQAYADAALVRSGLGTSGTPVSEVLGGVAPPAGASMYVRQDGSWYSSTLDQSGEDLTEVVRPLVAEGEVGVGWTSRTEPHAVVVGVPLPAVGAEYYEVSVARELDATLHTLAVALAVGAALTTVAGAGLGRAASRRVLAPLTDVTRAAVDISAGDLERRLRDTHDPDLTSLVSSFNDMVDALHSRIQRDARFAADVSHELRTPVTTLTTSLALLERADDLSPQAQQAVRLMSAELSRFRRALEDLLALGRLEAGIDEARVTTTAAHELARQALVASGRRADLLEDLDGPGDAPGPLVLVDRPQMVRALVNLYDNADLHGDGLVAVRVAARGGRAEISVRDRGPGVPEQDRRRIFERFARAGGSRPGTGSGLGLSLVAETVHRHGGDVRCDSTGSGAEFVVGLPLADSLADPAGGAA
ncbi:HAMP domain-containing sensor histidine kinase [uncultured Nocardioides sp.]|uniref:sensor histidine kinase n=1 Tax=uncultured Nocardioides sp. TaxID=198441 RepID=UPI00261CACBF|nr:HAMP domain-containing sensor histidine kinase [uncultured Nocardioides sp.]